MKGVFRPCWAENQPKNINVESNQSLQLWLVSICFSATLNWCQAWRASSRRDSVTRPQLRTDPNKVGGSQRSAAGASGLAVDVHAVPLLSVLQGKLHASVQVLQAGNAGEVNGGQPQLLHACSPPLLPPHYKQMQSVDYTQLQHNSVLFLCHVCNSVAEPLHTRPAAAALLDSFTHNMLAWYRWRKLTSAELEKYLVSYISFMVITARTFSVSTSCDTRNSFSVQHGLNFTDHNTMSEGKWNILKQSQLRCERAVNTCVSWLCFMFISSGGGLVHDHSRLLYVSYCSCHAFRITAFVWTSCFVLFVNILVYNSTLLTFILLVRTPCSLVKKGFIYADSDNHMTICWTEEVLHNQQTPADTLCKCFVLVSYILLCYRS